MSQTTGFSAFVSKQLKTADQKISEGIDRLRLQELIAYFLGLKPETKVTLLEFSKNIVELMSNPFFGEEEQKQISPVVIARLEAVYPEEALKNYLKKTRDEAVAEECVRLLFANPVDFKEIPQDDPRVWQVRRAYTAMDILDKEQLPSFAEAVHNMFPLLPVVIHNQLHAVAHKQQKPGVRPIHAQTTPTPKIRGFAVHTKSDKPGDGQAGSDLRTALEKSAAARG